MTGTKNTPARLTKDSATKGMMAIQAAAEQVQRDLLSAEGFGKTLAIATGLVAIQEAMTDETVAVLKALEGTDVGFKTDKDNQSSGYDAATIKACAVRALLHGAYLHGNEFNIIAGGCYLTQQYYMRKLREYPGVTDVQIDVDIPVRSDKGDKNAVMLVGGYAACKVNGKKVEIYARDSDKFGDGRIAVTAYQGDVDQAQGKAKKRLAQRLYERIAGVDISDESEVSGSVVVVDSEPKRIGDEKTVVLDDVQESQTDDIEERLRADVRSYGPQAVELGKLIVTAGNAKDRADVLKIALEQVKDQTLEQRAYSAVERLSEFLDHKEGAQGHANPSD